MNYDSVSSAISRRRPLKSTTHTQEQPGEASPSSSQNEAQPRLKRSLNLTDLIFYGVGCSVGAGIYSLVGIGADIAGPSIALSFLLCGIACCFTSLAYAEFSARVPLAGSAYTFTYVSFGELCGWLVGWNLTLGYAVSAAVVARSWAEYLLRFVDGLSLPWMDASQWQWLTHLPIHLPFLSNDYTCCPLAVVIIGLCTLVLITGAKESTRFNTAMTILNLSVLGFVLLAGIGTGTVHHDNLFPVFPHGLTGTAQGAGLVFFSFLGFDMVACLSEEVSNPSRNMPIGIIGSLLVSMAIYVSIAIVVVGMAPVSVLGGEVPIVNALLSNACCTHEDQLALAGDTCLSYDCAPILHPLLYTGSRMVSFGAIFGLTTATFACLMGQPRIFYSMAQDGLLFPVYARVHPDTGVPTVGTVLTGIFTAIIACFVDLEVLANVISLGTLQVFTFVNAGVIILRTRAPEATTEITQDDIFTVESSPLIQNKEAGAVARSMGLVKKSSRQIRDSLRSSLRRSGGTRAGPDAVQENGSKPQWLSFLFTVSCLLASAAVSYGLNSAVVGVSVIVGSTCAGALFFLPQVPPPETFECPWVPFVPLMGILCNSYMMGSMPLSTWVMILLWLAAGLGFYFSYGIHRSILRKSSHWPVSSCDREKELVSADLLLPTLNSRTSRTEGYDSILK